MQKTAIINPLTIYLTDTKAVIDRYEDEEQGDYKRQIEVKDNEGNLIMSNWYHHEDIENMRDQIIEQVHELWYDILNI